MGEWNKWNYNAWHIIATKWKDNATLWLFMCFLHTIFVKTVWYHFIFPCILEKNGWEEYRLEEFKIVNTMTQHMKTPLGIDVKNPVFSWNIKARQQNWKQGAFRLVVYKKGLSDVLLWDSGKLYQNKMFIRYGGSDLESASQYKWKVTVWSDKADQEPICSRMQEFEMGLLHQEDWKGIWIGAKGDLTSNPVFNKTVVLNKKIKRATAYVCGLGQYEFYIDDERIGDAVLQPAWTDYEKRCCYNTFEVTEHVKNKDEICISIMLADGMYHVSGEKEKRYVYYPRSFGNMKLLFQMHIIYIDGTKEQISSNTDWNAYCGPIIFSSIYGGVDYDARIPGIGQLIELREAHSYGTTYPKFCNVVEEMPPKGKVTAEKSPQVKVMKRLAPVAFFKSEKGSWIFDFGENFSGFPAIKIRGTPGKVIKLTPAELLSEDMLPNQSISGGPFYWKYTIGSEEQECWEGRFSYYGFRYLLVEGVDCDRVSEGLSVMRQGKFTKVVNQKEKQAEMLELTGCYIYSDIDSYGTFQCSNPLYNEIHTLITRAMRSNMKSILTDCPHREKFGWLEQTHLIGPALLYNYDMYNLYEKILEDIRDAQHENGLVPDIAPEYVTFGYHEGFVDSPEWGSAVVILPWYLYKKYGDEYILQENYESMKKYVSYLGTLTHHDILHHGLGDWCDLGPRPPYTQNTPVPVTATSMYYIDLDIMMKTAEILKRKSDQRYYCQRMSSVKREFNLQFFDSQTNHYSTGSQTAQAMALVAGFPDKEYEIKVYQELVKNIKANQFGTTAGDVGHPYVLAALTKYGGSDIIGKMMDNKTRPGYGYQVMAGATTLTEEWDGPNKEQPHGSQNHFMLGSGDEWFYSGLGGLRIIREADAFEQLHIRLYFPEQIAWVKIKHIHPYGEIKIEWKKYKNKIHYSCKIPPNTTAFLELEKTYKLIDIKTKLPVSQTEETTILTLGSGNYQLEIECQEEN